MAITTLNNRSINRSDTASADQVWTATSATASDFQAASSSAMATAYATTDTLQTVATDTLTDLTSITASITPSSTSSKILVVGRIQGIPSYGFGFAIIRGASNIFETADDYDVYPVGRYTVSPIMYIDSPSTTSSTTYKIQVKTYNDNTCDFQSGGTSNIGLIEILG